MVQRLRDVPGIGVDVVGDATDRLADPDMLRMEILDTDLPPPAAAIQATIAAIGKDSNNSYLPFLGQIDLRRAAVARLRATTGMDYDGETQCIVCAGGLCPAF